MEKNKTIIIGESGSGKSYKAIKMAIENKGTTIITSGCTKRSIYEDFYPELKDFVLKECCVPFKIEDGKKYFIESDKTLNKDALSKECVTLANSVIFGSSWGDLSNDENAMVIFDDGAWDCRDDRLFLLECFNQIKCQIVITVQDWDSILGLNAQDAAIARKPNIFSGMQNDILGSWIIENISKERS